MIFLNLSNGFWLKEYFKEECVYFTRFQSNHFQGVKQFDIWDYNLVFSLLLGNTFIFDGTIGNKLLSDGLRQFIVSYIVFLFYFRNGGRRLIFSKKEFLSDRQSFRKFLEDRFVFLTFVSDRRKSSFFVSIIDYVYNIFGVKDNINIANKDFLNQMFLDFRKYFWGKKWEKRWDEGKFSLDYKIYIFSERYENFFELFNKIKEKLPDRFLFVGNVKNFLYDDKTIEII